MDTYSGEYGVAIESEIFLPKNPNIPLGVDGIHVIDSLLYFTQFGSNFLGRVAISPNGSQIGPIEVVANLTFPDDFALQDDGTAFVAGANTLWRVSPQGKVDVLVGGVNDTVLEGATSAQFGRTEVDKDVLYVGTNGGLLAPVDGIVHGGQLAAINVGLFAR